MLSRRNIRTKLLETIYSATIDGGKSNKEIKDDYYQSVYDSYNLLLFVLQNLVQVASYSKEDKKSREKKYLPDEIDKKFVDRLSDNPYIQKLSTIDFDSLYTSDKPEVKDDVLKNVYRDFAKSEEYIDYFSAEDTTPEDEQKIVLDLFKFMLKSEIYEDYLRDIFLNYDTDKSHVKGSGKKVIKNVLEEEDYLKSCKPDDDTVEDFGVKLLKDYIENYNDYSDRIKEHLENWDLDRVALIDLICLRMGISELLNFETIPVKVTINEYLELVKNYSTEKSSDFVNGLIDKVLHDLKAEGKLNKSGRGLIE